MDEIYVFSNIPLDANESVAGTELDMPAGGGYCRKLYADIKDAACMSRILQLVFEAVIKEIVHSRLRKNVIIDEKDKSGVSVFFAQKLSAYLYITGNKCKIDSIVETLLTESSVLNIGGIVTFRINALSEDISAFFDLLFYEYKVQKKYDDFISLVRNYIEAESPRETALHVVFKKKGFVLFNTKMENITFQALKKYKTDSGFSENNINDFLISSLLHYLPRNIFIHIEDKHEQNTGYLSNRRIVETIKTIFKERVITCDIFGCGLCGCEADIDIPQTTQPLS